MSIEKMTKKNFARWLRAVNKIVAQQCGMPPVEAGEGLRLKAAGLYPESAAREAVSARAGRKAQIERQRAADKEKRALEWEARINGW
jgi:hypothetical protein